MWSSLSNHKAVGLALIVIVLVLSGVLGATVLREPIAYAASPFQNVIIGNDATKPVPVTQQGAADVQGTVSTRLAAPESPWFASEVLAHYASDVDHAFIAGPSGAINLTHVDVATFPDAVGQAPGDGEMFVGVWYVPDTATDCSTGVSGPHVWTVQYTVSPISASFPAPVHVAAPSGKKVCLRAQLFGGSASMTINASGFYG
jgi:hypothetical protein